MGDPLISVADVRVRLQSNLSDAALGDAIAAADAEVVRLYGPHYTAGTPVVVVRRTADRSVYLPRLIRSVVSIEEDGETLDPSLYRVFEDEGRIERLPAGSFWGEDVSVEFVPQDDNYLRRSVILDLVRLDLNRVALQGESIGGQYSYTSAAGAQEAERARILRRLAIAWV